MGVSSFSCTVTEHAYVYDTEYHGYFLHTEVELIAKKKKQIDEADLFPVSYICISIREKEFDLSPDSLVLALTFG